MNINQIACNVHVFTTFYLFHVSILQLLCVCSKIANRLNRLNRLFSTHYIQKYQICYSCHTDTNNLHYHYIISATSYLRNGTALCTDSLMQYLHHATSIFQSYGYTLELEVKDNV